MPPEPSPSSASPEYRAGTLVYTKAGLVGVFFWVLWGDFVLTSMELLQQTLLPVLLKSNGANDREIAIIVVTIASFLTAIINPIVSFKSDRTRTRWGRRIPYLVAATPFVAVTVALIPFSPQIAGYLGEIPWIASLFEKLPVTPVVLVFGVVVFVFQCFNMVIVSVYYYLFRDVIPVAFLGRFMSCFRIVGYLATFIFNYWIFGKAEEHSHEIFIAIAAIYMVGFMLMCFRLKEGEYLPVEATEKTSGGVRQAIRNFVWQSFGAPIYCWIYVTRALVLTAFISATFIIFFAREQLGLSLDDIGKLTAWPALLCLPLAYPLGVLLDRRGSMKILPWTLWAIIISNVAAFFFIHDKTTFLIFGTLTAASQFLFMIAQIVWLNRLFHQERIGQLSSAGSLTVAAFGLIAGPLCGQIFGWLKDYRYAYVWPVVLTVAALFAFRQVKRHWIMLGGHDHYQPPLPGASFAVAHAERGEEELADVSGSSRREVLGNNQ